MISTVVIVPQKQEREKITSILTGAEGINVLGHGKDGYDALKLIGSLKPGVAIVDNTLEFIDGGELPPLLKARSPLTEVIVLAGRISDQQLQRAAANEVSGFAFRETDIDQLPRIIKCVSEGGCFISPWFAARILRIFSSLGKDPLIQAAECRNFQFSTSEDPVSYLSKMELHVLSYIGEGKTSDEIAKSIGLTVGTVRNYISTIMHKTGLHNRSQLVRYAFLYGLLPLSLK